MAVVFLLDEPTAVLMSACRSFFRSTSAPAAGSIPFFNIFELAPPENLLDEKQQQSLLYSSDFELGETTQRIFDAMERVKPSRVVIDSLSEIRLLAQSSLRYRRQILALKHYFGQRNATVLFDDMTADVDDKTVHSLAQRLLLLSLFVRVDHGS
jgi:circadian clock protein KaiC